MVVVLAGVREALFLELNVLVPTGALQWDIPNNIITKIVVVSTDRTLHSSSTLIVPQCFSC